MEIPGIDEVMLRVNGAGHYMSPLLDFSTKADEAEQGLSPTYVVPKLPGLEPPPPKVERTSLGLKGIAEDLSRHWGCR